jgi:hypothetical protein
MLFFMYVLSGQSCIEDSALSKQSICLTGESINIKELISFLDFAHKSIIFFKVEK